MRTPLQIGLMSALVGVAGAETWTVDDDGPADFTTIQEAVDHAQSGDEILVSPGTYTPSTKTYEPIVDFRGKSLTLRSRDGAEVTIIDALDHTIPISIWNIIDPLIPSKIEGFTIRNGQTSGISVAGDCTLKVGFSIIEECREPGIWCYGDVNLTVAQCEIRDNDSTYLSGGILHEGGRLLLIDTTFSGNYSDTLGGALRLWGSDNPKEPAVILRCRFENNIASQGAAISANHLLVTVEECEFIENTGGQGTALYLNSGAIASIENSSFCAHDVDDIFGEWIDMGGNSFEPNCNTGCSADLDGNGAVDGGDLTVLLGGWGTCVGCPADLTGDGAIDGADLTMLLGMWGSC